MKRFKGFTLTELMIALAVIGVLTAVVTPAVMRIRPNKNKMMIKKAYYTTENIVSNLLNDANLYEDLSDDTSGTFLGFDVLNSAKVQGNTITTSMGTKKFAELFMSRLNSKNCAFNSNYSGNFKVCTTTDGMTWYLPVTGFGQTSYPPNGNDYAHATMYVDVNGAGTSHGPNCRQSGVDYAGTAVSDCSADNFDTFGIDIYEDGKMQINSLDTQAASYIEIDTKVTD